MNHCNCCLQEPGSNIVDFAIKLTTTGVGKVRLASHKQLFDPRNVALHLFGRDTENFFLFCKCTNTRPPYFKLLCGRRLFCPPFASPVRLKTFFRSLTHRWQLFSCSTFPQVALSMEILITPRLPSSKSSIHNNDSYIVRFLLSLKLCSPNAKPQCYLLRASA